MLGVSPWMWAWMGVWLARTVISALLIGRITKTVIEKADVKDLPEVLTGLSVLAGGLSTPSRPALQTAISAGTVTGNAKVREGRPAR
jgi:hypothetical protein